MTWELSCRDWRDRLRDGRSLVPNLPLDRDQAERAVAIFGRLRLPDVPGNPTLAEAAGEWFLDLVRAAFGSIDPATQQRMIQEFFVLVGKKNSKTTYSAALGLTWLLLNKRPKASGIIVAPTQDISDLSYNQAEGMVRIDGDLRDNIIRVQNHIRRLTNVRTGATLEIFTFDPSILTGQRPTFWLLDEIHVLARLSKAASALGQLRGGMISQPEAFGVIITTQSDQPPTGIFRTELNKARAIRDGSNVVSRTLPLLYEFPEDIARDPAKWRDPKNWPMVVPNRGRSIDIDRLAASFADAETSGQEEIIRWASQHLNIEIGVGLKTDHWPGARHWAKNADPSLGLSEILDRCDLVMVGGDGGGLDDMLGLAVIGREKETGDWLHWAHAWVHEDVLELRKEIAPALRDFERDGDLEFVSQIGDAFDGFASIVEEIRDAGLLGQVGLDPAGVKEIVDRLAARGITQDAEQVIGVRQGYTLCGTIKGVEGRLADGRLRHGGQRLMDWCVGNAMVKIVGSNVMVTKQASGVAKIDPLMATFDAADRLFAAPEAASVYTADRGLLVFG